MTRNTKIMTVREAACYLGRRLDSVYALVWVGKLPAYKQDGRWLISREAVEARRENNRRNLQPEEQC